MRFEIWYAYSNNLNMVFCRVLEEMWYFSQISDIIILEFIHCA